MSEEIPSKSRILSDRCWCTGGPFTCEKSDGAGWGLLHQLAKLLEAGPVGITACVRIVLHFVTL